MSKMSQHILTKLETDPVFHHQFYLDELLCPQPNHLEEPKRMLRTFHIPAVNKNAALNIAETDGKNEVVITISGNDSSVVLDYQAFNDLTNLFYRDVIAKPEQSVH